jgi:multidrug resistance protein
VAFGCGGLVAGPFSEEFGRNPVYIITMALFMIFIMASALAPNIGAQLAFRYIAGFFASTPLTCAGGSISDLFDPVERVFAFPMFASAAFLGPIFGPIVGGFIGESYLSWRWTEWVSLIVSGAILTSIVFTQPETYAPLLLKWKAKHLRTVTGDDRYVANNEVLSETFLERVCRALYRPFMILVREPIVIFWSFYITIIYVVLFTFLNGYTFIFEMTYGVSQGLTGLSFLGIAIGIVLSISLVPLIGKWYLDALKEARSKGQNKIPPENRLWFSMIGAPAVPISLFWMGWTARPDISIWSPLASSVLFGFGILTIFISCYQYLIDSYELFAASALASVTVVRYVASGGMVVVAIPMYENLGVHWTCTLMGCLSALMVPVPYLLYRYGYKIRTWSKYAVA